MGRLTPPLAYDAAALESPKLLNAFLCLAELVFEQTWAAAFDAAGVTRRPSPVALSVLVHCNPVSSVTSSYVV